MVRGNCVRVHSATPRKKSLVARKIGTTPVRSTPSTASTTPLGTSGPLTMSNLIMTTKGGAPLRGSVIGAHAILTTVPQAPLSAVDVANLRPHVVKKHKPYADDQGKLVGQIACAGGVSFRCLGSNVVGFAHESGLRKLLQMRDVVLGNCAVGWIDAKVGLMHVPLVGAQIVSASPWTRKPGLRHKCRKLVPWW